MTPLPPTGEDGAHGTSPPRSIDPNSIPSTPSRAAPARAASSARSARRFATVSGPNPIPLSGFFLKRRKESSPPSFSPPTSAARRALRRGDPEQGQGEEAREAPADPDRDHGGGGEGEAGEEGGQEGSQGASPIPTFAPLFRVSIGTTDPSPPRIFPSGSRLAKLTHFFRRVSSFRRRPRRRLASNARSSRRTAAPPRS